ncbi:MAG TPA: ferritin-like domain-containing protein [Polyangia bacterium]|nr:ferritin-like domain-containing protein [Polyangia bacterium]
MTALQAPEGKNYVVRPPVEPLETTFPLTYVWSYETQKDDVRALYEKAKREQWNATDQLSWHVEVDPEKENMPDMMLPIYGSHIWNRLTQKEILRLRHHGFAWILSQFLHGEQGALLATAQIALSVPSVDAKFYASTQVMDEARHVEVYERYLREKLELHYPVNLHLKQLLDQILSDARWDMKYLGMQILVEGLALAAFKYIHTFAAEPLIKELTHYIMRDEARHVAFGVLSLREFYAHGMSEKERRERQEFTYEACLLMRDRFLAKEVWENLGLPVEECAELALRSPSMQEFRKLLFSRIVPNIKRLGLLDSWLAEKFEQLGILRFQNEPADA